MVEFPSWIHRRIADSWILYRFLTNERHIFIRCVIIANECVALYLIVKKRIDRIILQEHQHIVQSLAEKNTVVVSIVTQDFTGCGKRWYMFLRTGLDKIRSLAWLLSF